MSQTKKARMRSFLDDLETLTRKHQIILVEGYLVDKKDGKLLGKGVHRSTALGAYFIDKEN